MAGLVSDRRALFQRGDILGHGFLQRFKCISEDSVFFYGREGEPVPPFACKFSPSGLHGNLLVTADEDGSIKLLNSQKPAQHSLIKEWKGHKNAIFDFAFSGSTHLVTGSGDSKLVQWDINDCTALRRFKGHTGSVKSVDIDESNPCVVVSGGRGGNILIWDTRCSSSKDGFTVPISKVPNAHLDNSEIKLSNSSSRRKSIVSMKQVAVTSVLFHRDHYVASSGAADSCIKLWDVRGRTTTPTPSHTFMYGSHGITSLLSDPYQSLLYAASTDNKIYVYDSVTLKNVPIDVFTGHKNQSYYIKTALSVCGRFLLSGSTHKNAVIWDTQKPRSPPTLLVGHDTEVTAVAWCPSQLDKIVTCSDSCDLRIWRTNEVKERGREEVIGYAERSTEKQEPPVLRPIENTSIGNDAIRSGATTPDKVLIKKRKNSVTSPEMKSKKIKVNKDTTPLSQRTINSFFNKS
ncbi:PREDICTED: denticleless protein homolog [Amphimedon queenslandica]|uniref:Denticleless protein homolog n=1 Tax=Amphimedon queenslandica TaxID=400682 RepID=A0AAN0J6R2_AMPQE|nr:PREDICTED: denticleless protein homolog [Amphimedon queenslandica]|eukprot:XP_019852720.1 PREDICTED: denticleless protein homolog [Amphimedon queenslandica]